MENGEGEEAMSGRLLLVLYDGTAARVCRVAESLALSGLERRRVGYCVLLFVDPTFDVIVEVYKVDNNNWRYSCGYVSRSTRQ